MNRPVNQTLNYVSQEMVCDGKFIVHLEMLEKLEDIIMSDDSGCFADDTGEPRPGVFQMVRTLRMLKDDIRTLNALCPDIPCDVVELEHQ